MNFRAGKISGIESCEAFLNEKKLWDSTWKEFNLKKLKNCFGC